MMRRLLVAVLMPLLVGGTASCGRDNANASRSRIQLSPGATSTITPTLSPEQQALMADKARQPVWTPAAAAPGEIVFAGVGVRYTPLSGAASLTAAQAVAVVTQQRIPSALATGTPIAQLASFTDDDFAPVDGAQTKTGVENVKSWVFTYTNSAAVRIGTSGPVGSGTGCDFVAVVDATTGTFLTSFQSCPGQVTASRASQ